MTRKAKAKMSVAAEAEAEDDGGAWMNDRDGPKMSAFLRRFTSEPKAEAPLKKIIMLSSPSAGGLKKNTLRMVSKQFRDDAEEGTTSIEWVGPENEDEDEEQELEEEDKEPTPVGLMGILANPVRNRDGFFKDRLPNLKSIDCRGIDTLMDLNGCPSGLEALHCGECKLIRSLAPLAACTSLRKLNLRSTKVSSLQPLLGCVKLEWLCIEECPISDLSPLTACTSLQVIYAYHSRVCDLSPLSGLCQLKLVSLWRTDTSDLSPLCSLPHLETLICSGTKISDLTPLSKCSELKALDICDTEVKSLAPLLQCKMLKYLNHSDLKGDEKVTEGYILCFKEQMPNLLCGNIGTDLWWPQVPSSLKHSFNQF